MSYEEEFDKLMRQKAEDMDFPFDESHWDKASKMITKSRGAGRSTLLKVAAGIVAVGGLVTAIVLYSPEKVRPETPEVATVDVNKAVLASEAVHSVPEPAANQHITKEETSVQGADAANTNVSTGKAYVSMKKKSGASLSENPVAKQSLDQKITAAAPASENTKEVLRDNNANQVPIVAGTVVDENQSQNSAVSQSNDVAVSENNVATIEQAEILAGKFSFLENGTSQPDIVGQRINHIKSPDYFKKTSKPIKCYLDAYAGGAYQNGWENNGNTDGAGVSWYGGLNAGYFLNKHISIGSGLQAFNIGNMKDPFYSVQSTSYDFSSVTTRTVINCTNMIYMAVPLYLGYHFSNNNSFRVGVYASQLVHASTSVESSTILDNEVTNKTTTKTNAIYYGMTQQLFMASAAYNMKVGKRVYVNAELLYGLNAIYSSNTYGGVVAKPAAFRLGIAYRLIER